jgi:hypothetical protein
MRMSHTETIARAIELDFMDFDNLPDHLKPPTGREKS